MRLISLRIENFGKLSGTELNFADGINILNRDNGWGKTTLAEFLCAMLYGFAGESKRSELENERKRYTPWQGGVYGGRVTFSENGKTYLLTRTFGAKAEGDTFELRFADTNLPSADFTEKVGEELFGIDRESFRKTIFIGQSECRAGATDGIHAKLGNLSAEQDDLSRYEAADKALGDKCNELTERRKTGLAARLAAEVTSLQTTISQRAHLESSIQSLQEKIETQCRDMEAAAKEQAEAEAVQKKASLQQDRAARRSVYKSLCEAEEARKIERDRLRSDFPGELPTEENLHRAMELNRDLDNARTAMEMTDLSEKQKADIRVYSEMFLSGIPDQEAFDTIWAKSDQLDRMREEDKETGRRMEKKDKTTLTMGITSLLLGVIALILAVLLYQWKASMSTVDWVLIAVGGVLALLGILMTTAPLRRREKNKYRTLERRETEERLSEELTEFLNRFGPADREANPEKALGRLEGDARRYEELLEAQQIFTEKETAYRDLRERTDKALEILTLIPDEDAGEQLRTLSRKLQDYRNAEAALETDSARRKKYESENDLKDLEAPDEELPTMEELAEQIRNLSRRIESDKDLIRTYEEQVDDLEEQREDRDRAAELLASRQEDLAAARTAFARLSETRELLTEARNRMTARFTQPLLDRFGHYYNVLTGQDSGAYHMDATASLTVEEYGRQREIPFLSSGYQDLLGVCQRLAFADLMFEDASMPFLVLDDPFVNLDNDKIGGAKTLLNELASRYQVIYFTCNKERVPVGLSRNEL